MAHHPQPTRRLKSQARLAAAAVAACFGTVPAWSQLPTNPAVTNGSATFSQAGKVLTVTNSNGATINWDTFSIGAGYTTHFNQGSASSSVLNRVVTADPSKIYGTLSSNGQVWLINPAGVLVGKGGVIDTARFVASTLKVGDSDFLAGRLNFQATPGAGNVDIEAGAKITTPSGGSVYLIGANVSNAGTIATPQGETILAAGETVSLIDTGTPGVKVEITGSEGNATNLGDIVATAGRVGMAGVIVRNSGTLNASSVVSEGGRVFLKASKDAYVDGAGRIVATGTKGGRVDVLGESVGVTDQAQIDVSGTYGGGKVLVGGDYQGKNPDVENANITYFGKDASIKADARENGDGGKVIIWADNTTRAYGSISARGGRIGGNGGFVETSGHRYLDFGARVDTRAQAGQAGTLLIDPTDMCIDGDASTCAAAYGGYSYLSAAALNALFPSNSNVIVQTDGAGGGGGNIVVRSANISYGGASSLTLLAYGGLGGSGNLSVSNSSIQLSAGSLTLVSGWSGTGIGTLSGIGDLSITQSNFSATSIDLRAGRDISIAAGATGSYLWASGALVAAGRNIYASGGATSNNTTQGPMVFAYGGTSMTLMADQSIGEISLQGGTASNASYGGQYSYGGSVIFQSGGSQTVVANKVRLTGGASGHDNAAILEADGGQYVTVYGGGLWLQGGGGIGGYNNSAAISQRGTGSSQSITVFGGGTVAMYGGTGTGTGGYYDSKCGTPCAGASSHNMADISNKGSGGQTFDFIQGGTIALYGGSGGTNNDASIDNDAASLQKIWSSTSNSNYAPTIYVRGGSGGAVVYGGSSYGGTGPNDYYHLENGAGISSGETGVNGSQTIFAKGITLIGGGDASTVNGGAYLGAQSQQTVVSYGSVTLTGGAGNTVAGADFAAPAAIGSEEDANISLAVYGGDLTLTGGSGIGSPVLIGSLHYGASVDIGIYGGDVVMTGNTGGVAVGSYRKAGASGTPIDTSVRIRTEGAITGSGNVRIGAFDAPLAAVGVAMTAGKNISLSSGVKVGTDGSPGSSSLEIKAGVSMSGFGGSATGGDLTLASSTVYGNSVNLQAYGGSTAAGNLTLDSASSVYGSSVQVVATGNVDLNGIVRASSILGVGAGYYDTAFTSKSLNGGNISMGVGATAYGGTSLSFRASAGTSLNGSTGRVGLTQVESPLVQVNADRQIFDNNGASVANVIGQSIGLHSLYGGTADTLAVSADVQVSGATSSLSATVGTSATYGGISLRNVGSAEANSLSMMDHSLTGGYGDLFYQTVNNINMTAAPFNMQSDNGGVFVSSSGAVTLNSMATLMPGINNAAYRYIDIWGQTGLATGTAAALVNAPDVFLGTGGTMTVAHSLGGAGNLGLYAGGAMNVTANVGAAYDVGMWAAGGLSLTNSTVTAGSGNAYIGSSALVFDADGGLSHTGGGGITLTNSAVKALNGDIFAYTSGDIRLNNGSYFQSGYSIYLDLVGATSTLYLNDVNAVAYSPSYVLAGSPTTIDLEFPARSANGVVIDGVTTTTSTAGGSGLFVVNHSTPATVGAGLNIVYGIATNPTVTAAVNEVVTTINTTTTSTPSATTTTTENIPPPPTPATGTTSLTSLSTGTVGGGTGQFGGSESTTASTTSSSTTPTTDSSSAPATSSTSATTSGDGGQSSATSGESSAAASSEQANDAKKDEKKEDKKDDKSKKADSGGKKDDKTKQKPVGKCSA